MIYILFFCLSFIYSQCDEYINQFECVTNLTCDWVEDIESGSCGNLSESDCQLAPECNWEYECFEYGWWYNWCYEGGYVCNGGTYSYDNGYCQEIEMPECSDSLTESSCNDLEQCEWVDSQVNCENLNTENNCNNYNCNWNEDIENINCSTLPTYGWGPGTCDYYYPDCYEYLDYGGSYGSWSTACGGGVVQIDESYCDGDASYCEEIIHESGDINQDNIVNIQDIIIVINLILNGELDLTADINFDNTVNVLDVIQLVNIILDN